MSLSVLLYLFPVALALPRGGLPIPVFPPSGSAQHLRTESSEDGSDSFSEAGLATVDEISAAVHASVRKVLAFSSDLSSDGGGMGTPSKSPAVGGKPMHQGMGPAASLNGEVLSFSLLVSTLNAEVVVSRVVMNSTEELLVCVVMK